MNITTIQCRACGAPLRIAEDADQTTCDYCGTEQAIERNHPPAFIQVDAKTATNIRPRSQLIAFFLCLFLGAFGAHRFYAGQITSGIIQLVTLGGLGIWQLIDLVWIGLGRYRDVNGVPLHSDNPALPRGCLFGLLAFMFIFCGGAFMASAVLGGAAGGEPINDQVFSTAFSVAFWAAIVVGIGVVVWVVTRAKRK